MAEPYNSKPAIVPGSGTITDTTSNLSSTCLVLALVARRQDCQRRTSSQQQMLHVFSAAYTVSRSVHHDVNP